jgi:valyl-tRNA synthetase
MRTPVTQATVTGPATALSFIEAALPDLRAAGKITGDVTLAESPDTELTVEAQLAPHTDG